jgi:biotin operon repressor
MKSAALAVAFWLCILPAAAQAPPATPEEWKPVEAALHRSGSMQPGDVFKFGLPRSDLKVSVGGVPVATGVALGAWAAFKKMGDHAVVMGDLVLAEGEVAPVMKTLQQGGFQITALHNHLLGESPRVLYMHYLGSGDAAKLAETLAAALKQTGTPAPAAHPATPPKFSLDVEKIDEALGRKGSGGAALLQFGVPRTEKIEEGGMEVPPAMGVATGINFAPTGASTAEISGDFVLLGSEVNPVIRALHQHGIEVTAVHSHMLDEQPRLFFLHFWAEGDAVQLARGLRAALDATNSKK